MREISAIVRDRVRKNRLTIECPVCKGSRWVLAVSDLPDLTIECPACSGQGRLLALAVAIDGQVTR
jgi:hypothetical protein